MELGTVIRKKRAQKDLTQEWIADSIGISSVAYQKYELGKSRLIHPNYFKICKLLEIHPCLPIREMLGEENENNLVKEPEGAYLSNRINLLEKKNEDLIAENAVLKYKLKSYEDSAGKTGNSKKAG